MKKILILLTILTGGLIPANAQWTQPTPMPINIRPNRTQNTDMRNVDGTQGVSVPARNPAYRKPTKDDLRLVAPDAELREKYADFLRVDHTGLIRMLSDAGCQENAALVVVANEFCLKYKNIFGGSAYSFRTGNYTLGRFSDVVYKSGALYSIGTMTLGFLVDLGAGVALKDVSAQTPGAGYVFNFSPPAEVPQIEASVIDFQKGVAADGFSYRKAYALEENHTYLLRSVAYRKRVEGNKPVYDDLAGDARKDVIVAFQVVKFADAEKSGVTLLWKELQRKNTSKIAIVN